MSKTQDLRDECKRRGIKFTCGYFIAGAGKRTDEDTVTTIWDGNDVEKSLTFEEDGNGCLWCADEMSVSQCIGAYLAGLEDEDEGD